MSLTTLLVAGGIVTFLLLAGLAVIGFANRQRSPGDLGAADPGGSPSTPDQPTLPGLDQ